MKRSRAKSEPSGCGTIRSRPFHPFHPVAITRNRGVKRSERQNANYMYYNSLSLLFSHSRVHARTRRLPAGAPARAYTRGVGEGVKSVNRSAHRRQGGLQVADMGPKQAPHAAAYRGLARKCPARGVVTFCNSAVACKNPRASLPSRHDCVGFGVGVPADSPNDHLRLVCAFKACPSCGASLHANRNPKARRERIYCSDACRARAWRLKVGNK